MKKTILVIDDDTSVRNAFRKLLRAEGYQVLVARESVEALEIFRSEIVHLVVMDVNLGADDGWETLERMVGTNGAVPIIIVTAELGLHGRAMAAGAEALVEKPMDVPLFLEIVERLLAPGSRRVRTQFSAAAHDGHYIGCRGEALRRDLERRCSTPLDMSWFEQVQLTNTVHEN